MPHRAGLSPPDPTDLLDDVLLGRLQSARAYPSVSVLLTTAPGPMLASHDAVRLDRLIDVANRRLCVELPTDHVDELMARLRQLAVRARRQPAKRALGLYASDHQTALVQLPMAVIDRVVVDPTFATRDLLRALALRPRFRLLVVSERTARVIEGWPGQLKEIAVLPPATLPKADRGDRGRRFGRERTDERRALCTAQFRAIAETLGTRHAAHPLPLIVAGVARHQAFWKNLPHLGPALIGSIPGNHDRTSIGRLDGLARRIVDEHVRAGRRAVLQRLAAEHPARCVGGIDDVWAAAAARRIELLCVEDGYVFPARPVQSGRQLLSARDVEHPEVLDDAVDELIEMVALAEGEIIVVPDGSLDGCGHVAALLRTA